ncbi:MAG TPA: malto-oligosyltrehalose synthase [Verrucomicrobiae bacterium]|nr:malto-oligosyltrehalose synthase [Verrucomicrobiae bacterium]
MSNAIEIMHLPRATYRLQFNGQFRLSDALVLVPYFHALGISHLYASPLFKAAPRSSHGYDVADYTEINSEIGTEDDLEKLAAALHEKKMGLVLDIVPNHMGIAARENLWWWDVLLHGAESKYADHFDIDWKSPHEHIHGKVLIPLLGGEYETLVTQGAIKLVHENGQFLLSHYEHRFPLTPNTVTGLPTDADGLKRFNSDFAALDQLIRRQHYCLEFHEHGDGRLNYRRFFAVSSLAAVRVEDEKVFKATHVLVRRWVEKGWIDGLRVDHPDGLRDPAKYLQRLRKLAPKAWIVVEKIVEPGEMLPGSWPVQGTTGYDWLNQINGLFIDPNGEKAFTDFYKDFIGESTDYAVMVREKKRSALKTLLATELHRLTNLLAVVAKRRKTLQKFSRVDLQEALAEILVCFPVYRSYISEIDSKKSAADIAMIKTAARLASNGKKRVLSEIITQIQALLVKRQSGKAAQHFIARFQQLTGPVMAKGVEDTAFYCFNRFTSLNEVGGDPEKFGINPDEFHEFAQRLWNDWPDSQITTSTHDTKRAEDVRARLNVLSEMPDIWSQTVRRWSAMNACHRQNELPDRKAEYLFYQTLAGAWPLSEERAQFYMEKAAHESKEHTTWTKRNIAYEKALKTFVSETLRDPEFTADVERFTGTLANAAAVNSLAQTLLKLVAPGVPDIYQGCELWDFSLVDPDNRRTVDFDLRRQLLAEAKNLSPEEIWKRRANGLPKLWLIQKALHLREQSPDFAGFDYQPIFANGSKSGNVFGLMRGEKVIAIVPRFLMKLNNDWQDTSIQLPAGSWHNELSGEDLSGEIRAEHLFRKFPVALLLRKEED